MITGHRPSRLFGHEDWIRDVLRTTLVNLKNRYAQQNRQIVGVSGMAVGVDTIFAEEVLAEGIGLIAGVPFVGQESQWHDRAQKHYHDLLSKAQETFIVSPGAYAPWKMLVRNTWLVQHSDMAICVWDGVPTGGTAHAVNEIRKHQRSAIHVNHLNRTITKLTSPVYPSLLEN